MSRKPSPLLLSLTIFFLALESSSSEISRGKNKKVAMNVGVVLDMDSWVGKMGLCSITVALSDFYASHPYYKTRLVLKTRDSMDSLVGAASAAQDLIKNEQVVAIIGPTTSPQAKFLINLGEITHVPIISFSATSSFLSLPPSPYFIQAAFNDSSQVKAITALIQAFGWRAIIPIYVENEYGEGLVSSLTEVLQEVNISVPYRSKIRQSANDEEIVEELERLRKMKTRVYVVHMLPSLGSRVFIKAKEVVGMMSEGSVWIITDGLTNFLSLMDSSILEAMQGVVGLKPNVPGTKEADSFTFKWRKQFQDDYPTISVPDPRLNIFSLWAYDAAVALAMAVEKVGVRKNNFKMTKKLKNPKEMVEKLGVSQIGENLSKTLISTRFRGLGGDFHIVNGQLHVSAYQIVNVIGNGDRGIGFWTPKSGIVKKFDHQTPYSASRSNLEAILWPGFTTKAPNEGVVSVNMEKKLRIGVPVKDGPSPFVNVTRDPITNKFKVTGFCIDVFDAVMEAMPYKVPYEYIPFARPDGKRAGGYDELVFQVFLGNFDGVVGDITIVANRSLYVDFTLPFTDSGVGMVVPLKYNKKKSAWIFLKPLTWDLWVTSACFFVFIGFVIYILEHKSNDDFEGSQPRQVATSMWFSFSTLVFAHKEKIVTQLARFVVIIWCFVVLILTQSYTASLTTMLTLQKMEPTVTSTEELIQKGLVVGYPQGSFVLGLLNNSRIDGSKLRMYATMDDLDKVLSRGSGSGGVDAAFDEIPYMKLFCAKHCSKYAMVEITHQTAGFGFAFPRGSPLVPNVSRAVLNVTQGSKMREIEHAWFGLQLNCPDPRISLSSSNSLNLGSFWGLFLIVGAAASFAIIVFLATFAYEHRRFLMKLDVKNRLNRFFFCARLPSQSPNPNPNPNPNPYGTGIEDQYSPSSFVNRGSTDMGQPSRSTSPSVSDETDADLVWYAEQNNPPTEYHNPTQIKIGE